MPSVAWRGMYHATCSKVPSSSFILSSCGHSSPDSRQFLSHHIHINLTVQWLHCANPPMDPIHMPRTVQLPPKLLNIGVHLLFRPRDRLSKVRQDMHTKALHPLLELQFIKPPRLLQQRILGPLSKRDFIFFDMHIHKTCSSDLINHRGRGVEVFSRGRETGI